MLKFANGTRRGVISIGECMVEMARGDDGRFGLGYGGDTFNTAIYLARAGISVAYATLLGDDPYSQGILELARKEDVATDLIGVVPGRNAGLYMIETAKSGERTFHYWRERAPARELFSIERPPVVANAMTDARLVYFSGITLSLYDADGLDALEAALLSAKESGARVAIDGNYRPRGWGANDAGRNRARRTFERFFRISDLALPTFDDEQALWGDDDVDTTLRRLKSWGVAEIALKRGGEGAIVSSDNVEIDVPIPNAVTAIDTTAAGDSFNAAYLAARLKGAAPEAAARDGHVLAGAKIEHRGAIMPREAMPPELGYGEPWRLRVV
jgi:2-dehydro-3-deoxygluconokinase